MMNESIYQEVKMKSFNTTGICIPEKHYMVDITERLEKIKEMVDAGKYFSINKGRQYGKTTTLGCLKQFLSDEYDVLSLDFQGISSASYQTEEKFVRAFCRTLKRKTKNLHVPEEILEEWTDFIGRKEDQALLDELFDSLSAWCESSDKPLVMLIDEVDQASNNQVFLDFLAQIRMQYLERGSSGTKTFQSVILAGVTDIRHLKSKLRPEEQSRVNSPWNIATAFTIDMELSQKGIEGMLIDYDADHHTGMDCAKLSEYITKYTNGYPFLVSRICELIDTGWQQMKFETMTAAWTEYGVDEAVKQLLSEDNTLFGSLMGKLYNYPNLKDKLRDILIKGDQFEYLPDDEEQKQLIMYSFIVKTPDNKIKVANEIFEMRLYRYYLGEKKDGNELIQTAYSQRPLFIENDGLNVPLILDHFKNEYLRIRSEKRTEKFAEEEGRELFLFYISAIINGTGTYSIEEETRNRKRMDVVIHYLGKRYVIEMKIWHGERYNEKGEAQLSEYLDYFGLDTGYMISYNFNQKKEVGVKRVPVGDRIIFEATL